MKSARVIYGGLSAFLFACVSGTLTCSAHAQTVEEYNAAGVEAHDAGNWDDAIKAFEKAYDLAPENETVRHNLSNTYLMYGNSLAEAKDFKEAIVYANLAMKTDPGAALPLVQLGAYYVHEGRIVDAIYRLEEAVELEPENVDAHFLLGESYYRDNDASSALDQWEWVYAVDPERQGLRDRLETALRQEKVEFDFKGQSSRNFSITYTRSLKTHEVRDILHILEAAYREIGRAIGSNAYPPTPIRVTLYSAEGFSETTQMGDHVGALYDGTKIRCPVFDKHGRLIDASDLKRRLYHEYVHVVVRHIAKDDVPWWLNEGLAETLSHELDAGELIFLREAIKSDALFSLGDLDSEQLSRLEGTELDIAYRQSHATVSLLKERYGTRMLGVLLHNLAQGEDAETALRRSCKFSYRSLELAVANYVRRK